MKIKPIHLIGIGLLAWLLLDDSNKAGAIGMARFNKVRVYEQAGKPKLRFTANKSGCYIIYENGKRVYVGQSQNNLYRTITRHFQEWNGANGTPVIYNTGNGKKYEVGVIFCTGNQALSLEKTLITTYQPRDNELKYKNYQPDNYDEKTAETFIEEILEDAPF